MRDIPPRLIPTSIARAPASMLFSTSSFTTDAGRSTTSPAATWLARVSGRSLIRLIGFLILSPFDSLRSQRIDYTHHEFICCPEEAPTFWRSQGKLSDVQDITFAAPQSVAYQASSRSGRAPWRCYARTLTRSSVQY